MNHALRWCGAVGALLLSGVTATAQTSAPIIPAAPPPGVHAPTGESGFATPAPVPAWAPCGTACGSAADCPLFWARADYLFWWARGQQLPPLLTESDAGTPQAQAGVLGQTSTRIIAGDERINDELRSGIRLRAGTCIDCGWHPLRFEASFFVLESQAQGFTSGPADTTRLIGRPFTNAVTGLPDAQLVSFPGVVSGTADVVARGSNVHGVDIVGRESLWCGHVGRRQTGYCIDAVVGYRYLGYESAVGISQSLQPLGAAFVPGTLIQSRDDFNTRNHFHGGVLGLATTFQGDRWSLEVATRIDVGQVYRKVSISGSTTTTVPGAAPVTNTGGLLALSSNIGTFGSREVTAVPELDVTAAYHVTDNLRLTLGYSFLYWWRVAHAGEQIDLRVNRTLIPPVTAATEPSRPAFELNANELWLQGFSLGVDFRY